jgi:CubicO group peptidase (beta-lactamase class C family)
VRKAVAILKHLLLSLRAFLRLKVYRLRTEIGWYEAKAMILWDAVRAYLTQLSPPMNLSQRRKSDENYQWQPGRGTRFILVNKRDGSVRSYSSEAFFAFHYVNSFEKGSDIFVDIAAYTDSSIIEALYLERLRAGDPVPRAELRRYRLPANGATADYELLATESIELPRINYRLSNARDYRYAYGIGNRPDRPADFPDQLVKVDVHERSARVLFGCTIKSPFSSRPRPWREIMKIQTKWLSLIFVACLHATLVGQNRITPSALDELLAAAQRAHSDALVIWKDGRPLGEWYFGQKPAKIEAMSVTKSVVSLAIGRLLTEGKIRSVDQPVHEFYPEWNQGRKKKITIRHLLNHTSGLQNVPRADIEIYPSPDFVQLALAAELSYEPGTAFSYNNKAVNLLAGIIQRASGQRMDLYIKEALFLPLGITDFSWTLDRAENPHVMAGLQIFPADLAKIGQLVLNRGRWNGHTLIAESWFDLTLRPGQEFEPTSGLLWLILYDRVSYVVDDDQIHKLMARGVGADFLRKVSTVKGRYESRSDYEAALRRAFGERWRQEIAAVLEPLSLSLARKEPGKPIGYYSEGYLGQYLIILPEEHLVVVRMIRWRDGYDEKTDTFSEILELAPKLVRTSSAQ